MAAVKSSGVGQRSVATLEAGIRKRAERVLFLDEKPSRPNSTQIRELFVSEPLHIAINHYGAHGHCDGHMSNPIPLHDDEDFRPGPVRILMRDGQWLREPELIEVCAHRISALEASPTLTLSSIRRSAVASIAPF